MHYIEPYHVWRSVYIASEDENSPMFGYQNSEFEYTHALYNYIIHPQWDDIGSPTLFIKILYANYNEGFCVIELMGEWNDCLHNDIMYLKRNIADPLVDKGIQRFILIGENLLNFHSSDDCYYQEWFDDLEEGWIVAINFRDFVIKEFIEANIDYYIAFGTHFDDFNWRKYSPIDLYKIICGVMSSRFSTKH